MGMLKPYIPGNPAAKRQPRNGKRKTPIAERQPQNADHTTATDPIKVGSKFLWVPSKIVLNWKMYFCEFTCTPFFRPI